MNTFSNFRLLMVLISIPLYSCSSQGLKAESCNYDLSVRINRHWSPEECTSRPQLAAIYHKAYHDTVKLLLFDISNGTYSKKNIPGSIGIPRTGSTLNEYIEKLAAYHAVDDIVGALLEGYEVHKKVLLKEGWTKPAE